MKYTRVRRAVSAVVIDSWDEDRNPEHIKVNGNVTFTPLLNDGDVVQWAGPNGPESLVLAPIQCRISDGIIMHRGGEGVYLAAGGKGCEPDLIQWKAEFSSMQAGGWAFKLKPVMFDAVPDGEVDLTMVAPVAGASEPIVRGPAGTGIDNIKVDGAELVITARSEAGVFEMARIPLEDVVKAEAATAAKSAADSVRTEFTTAASNAAASAKSAATSAQTATTKAGDATTQAANAKTSASAAKTSETNAANSASAAATSAAKAEGSATTAATSAQTATSKANEANTQAANAANSAGAAKTSETNALSSANAAKNSESSAKTSENNAASSASGAKSSASAASSSASNAATSEKNAAKSASAAASSASQAAGSATSAKQDADRAATIAGSTSWNGDKLTVNGKTSPSLTGPRGDQGPRGIQGPKGSVEPGEVVPLPRGTMEPGTQSHIGASWDLSWNGGVAVMNIRFISTSQDGRSYVAIDDEPRIPQDLLPNETVNSDVFEIRGSRTATISIAPDGSIRGFDMEKGAVYRGIIVWAIGSDVSAMSGPAGPKGAPGEVSKSQLDTAIASEKARTVGVTWTVPRESDVAAKASAAQTGDYIQVAQTHTIYRVTSGGVTVEKYGTRTLQASTDPNSNRNPNQWLESGDPWAGVNWSRVSPPAGKWLVELINQHDFSASLYVSGKSVGSVTKGTMSYIAEFSTAAKSDVYVQIPGDNYYKPLGLRFTPIN